MAAVASLVEVADAAAAVVADLVAADAALWAADAAVDLVAVDYKQDHLLVLVVAVALLTRLSHLAFGFQTEFNSKFLTK